MSLVKEVILFYLLFNLLKHFIILGVSFTHRREGSYGGFSLTGNSVAFTAAEARPRETACLEAECSVCLRQASTGVLPGRAHYHSWLQELIRRRTGPLLP